MKTRKYRSIGPYRRIGLCAMKDGTFSREYERADVEHFLNFALRRKYHKEIVDAYSNASGMSGYALLYAHGGHTEGSWICSEKIGRKKRPLWKIQDWIDGLDGSYLCLIVACCNPRNDRISSKKSIVFHLDSSFNLLSLIRRKSNFKMYFPGEGYLTDSRKRRKVLDNLA